MARTGRRSHWGLLFLRIVVGVMFVVHGYPKITGGKGMAEAMAGGPSQAMTAVITVQGLVETGGGILLALGVLTQLVAIALGIIMIGAIFLKITRFRPGSSLRPPPVGSSTWSFSPPRCCSC